MTNTVMLPYQNLDVPQVFYYINDLAFDEDDELLFQLASGGGGMYSQRFTPVSSARRSATHSDDAWNGKLLGPAYVLAEDKTEWTPLSFSRIMILPPLYADVPSHLPPPHPPPFPGDSSPSPIPGGEPGLCGLTNDQWHMVLIFSIPLLLALGIAFVISWFNGSEISFLWLRVQDCVKSTRMGLRERLFGHLLSEDDIRNGLIATGPDITPRRYPTVDFILAQYLARTPNANTT
ncbi:hypothetical protein BGY98DRAFT_936581 [Russula aff. rugulosa BPL654]|nr:hypothetical protein BGY98DRAFT_936581 [Russula aff. rugulosa BPL654]